MKKLKTAKKVLTGAILLCGILISVVFSTQTAEQVRTSLLYTFSSVIPTLFPFMVISRLIISSDVKIRKSGVVARMCKRIFGLSADAAGALMLSLIGCFPIGAVAVSESCKSGRIDRSDAARAFALTHNTGPSFPVIFVGGVLWQSKRFGAALYCFQIVAWVLVALLYQSKNVPRQASTIDVDGSCVFDLVSAFPDAICKSAQSCFNIAAFTAFMRFCSSSLLLLLPNTPFYAVVVSSALEFSDGCTHAARLGGVAGCALCGFAVGWGGLCAVLQAAPYARECGASMRPLILVKLLEGLICTALAALYGILFPLSNVQVAVSISSAYTSLRAKLCLCVIAAAYLLMKILTYRSKGDKIS